VQTKGIRLSSQRPTIVSYNLVIYFLKTFQKG
jgi:hypothetical protein